MTDDRDVSPLNRQNSSDSDLSRELCAEVERLLVNLKLANSAAAMAPLKGYSGQFYGSAPNPSRIPIEVARNVDVMTHAEFEFAREFLGLKNRDLKAHFGVSDSTVSAWSRRVPVPRAVARYLWSEVAAVGRDVIDNVGRDDVISSRARGDVMVWGLRSALGEIVPLSTPKPTTAARD